MHAPFVPAARAGTPRRAAEKPPRSRRRVAAAWLRAADTLGLRGNQVLEFPSVVLPGDKLQPAGIKAVRAGYPLRGSVRTAAVPYGAQFGRRRRGMLRRVGLGLGAIGGVLAGGLAVGVSLGGYYAARTAAFLEAKLQISNSRLEVFQRTVAELVSDDDLDIPPFLR